MNRYLDAPPAGPSGVPVELGAASNEPGKPEFVINVPGLKVNT